VRVRISQPALVPDLVEFLRRASCETDSVRGPVLDVRMPFAGDRLRARRDLGLYLAAWGGLHPPVEVTIIDDRGRGRSAGVRARDAAARDGRLPHART